MFVELWQEWRNTMSIWDRLSRHKIIQGTLILTVTGFITRILGFVYKIYLADILGAHMLGLYQLVFPVYAVCFTLYGSGIQTSISHVIASNMGKNGSKCQAGKILAAGTAISFLTACLLSLLVCSCSEWIALHFVMEPALAQYLRILSVLFPFCSLSACINGYYYGIQEAKVPALSQMIEQLGRVFFVLLCCNIAARLLPAGQLTQEECLRLAVWGLVVGEAVACFYNLFQVKRMLGGRCCRRNSVTAGRKSAPSFLSSLLWMAGTLTLTKLLVSFLNSIESILLPAMLRRYGCSPSEALSIYGILTGMSLSFIFFPSTVTNSFAVMLLPSIAEAGARNDREKIRRSIITSIKYCLLIGFFFQAFFFFFGEELGFFFFHNELAGAYLRALSWLCPFLYLGTTLTSILNGMAKTQITFFFTMASLGIKIAVTVFAVPIWGIYAYLTGLLISQILLVLFETAYLCRYLFRKSGTTASHHSILVK